MRYPLGHQKYDLDNTIWGGNVNSKHIVKDLLGHINSKTIKRKKHLRLLSMNLERTLMTTAELWRQGLKMRMSSTNEM